MLNSLVLEDSADIGIFIEIIGFILILVFWRVPAYSDLHRWKQSQILYKIFGKARYFRRITDDTEMTDDDTITRATGMAMEGDNMVPKPFLSLWKRMKIVSFALIIIGLGFQFSFIPKTAEYILKFF